ncbi:MULTISPECIES: NAD-dependent epimerase/dehydratase family protein [unclassified Pseudomonas]|jgi:nucleoside-diphosphate-sugar epimerase|uniref:NAD-dependent epimerase/dehydratase family protein n=1 Tax=unclassified Pseudomonas TaxID=196821 RepID=UPI000272CA9E|nr:MULTISPECIES: NAD-dependent epimerase/dehydratase family protein [unclassified Pseudomonas]EJF73742.1 male sterility protein-like protein [Pseudomonas sp. Ag1]NWB24651.1 NAD-dependent epimerase/dehydratase family protein [Pseudomonas sp. D4002]NWB70411.1 NAD-dependent epimerase/dehydratase family protein [Pseudomonas sp. I8001]
MKIFLTGANGFVGGSVAHHLIAQGHSVRGLLRDPQKAGRLQAQGITPVIGSLDDRQLLIDEARQADAVIDAANSDHAGAVDAFIEALRGSGKLLIHTSGSSIIGDDALGNTLSEHIFDEDTPFIIEAPKQARYDIDLRMMAAADQGIRSVVICPSNIYGVGHGLTDHSFQLPFLMARARETGVMRIVGAGVNRWSNVHIDDVAQLFLLAVEKAPAGAFYFLENGEASFIDMAAALAKRMNLGAVQSWPAEEAEQHWDPMHVHYTFGTNSRVKAKRARAELGWAPRHASILDWIGSEMPL